MELVEYKGLLAPQSYVNAQQAVKASICNGCGIKGWKGTMVPETAWGLSLTRACNIHDWMYSSGISRADKVLADKTFHTNMRRLILDGTSKYNYPLRYARYTRAYTYYNAVKRWGDTAFWNGKEQSKS